ncbi:hypothetical protein GE061_003389 [Apolygus lucorum]|uniref:C2H2-type domain-containing protein n=1 Tax=Apolygus lucorum TaxID=248454 RepID=A0A8S9X3N6_APOLU|nr:hypothetical protein GE061_003389 [Apolygus lucorum]
MVSFACPSCPRSFKFRKNLNIHIKYDCGVGPKFGCMLCTFTSISKQRIIQHYKGRHDGHPRLSKQNKEQEKRKEEQTENVNIRSEEQEEETKAQNEKLEEIKDVQTKKEISKSTLTCLFSCTVCPFTSKEEGLVLEHIKILHIDTSRKQDQMAEKKKDMEAQKEKENFQSEGNEENYIAQQEELDEISGVPKKDTSNYFKCPKCPRRYQYRKTLRRHFRQKHQSSRIFSCSECLYQGRSRDSFLKHVESHRLVKTPKDFVVARFPCSKCSRSYKYKKHLNRHLQYECGVEPRFCCSLCPFKGKTKAMVIRHLKKSHNTAVPQQITVEPPSVEVLAAETEEAILALL